jgi:diguanylate cyclase (GGDEF)-like protein
VQLVSSGLRQRLSWSDRDDATVFTSDRAMAARALMYLLAGVGTAIVASMVVPGGPLEHESGVPIVAAITYAAAIGVLVGFDKMPRWGFHVLLLAVTALICWAIYKSGESGSPYKVFFFWVAIYAAFFMSPVMTGVHIGAMLVGYAIVLIALGDQAQNASLHWALTASALVLVGVAIQALNANVRRLIARLTEIGRTDSLTGLYDADAFNDMLEKEVERARRSGNRLGILVAEIDGFAPVRKGPMSADQQRRLTAVGEIFRTQPRQIDLPARLGGSRFGLLLPYTDEHGGYLLAERLRTALAQVGPIGGQPLRMSLGVAGFPRHGASGPAVFQAAETALAEAQEAGGDRVMLFQRSSASVVVEVETVAPEELLG